jgi:hypothetical protein
MIPVTTIAVEIDAKTPIRFHSFPGVSIRAALYSVMSKMYDTHLPASQLNKNPVSYLFSMENAGTSGGQYIPRPIAIKPPLNLKQENLEFGFSLIGNGIQYLPQIFSAIDSLQDFGLGVDRTPFHIRSIKQINDFNKVENLIIDKHHMTVGKIQPMLSNETIDKICSLWNDREITMQFLTPMAVHNKRKIIKKPIFLIWFQRLLERIRLLSEHYAELPLNIPFHHLLTQAKAVEIVKDETFFYGNAQSRQYSRKIVGFVGKVTYRGELQGLLPYILVGQMLHAGKNVVKGCGWFSIIDGTNQDIFCKL